MSLVLVWNDDAKPHADRDLLQVATNVATSQTETFDVCQSSMVTAFRLLVCRNIIKHTEISLRVQQLVVTFNEFGTLEFPHAWPVPTYSEDLLRDLMMEGVWKKRAAKSAQVVV